MYSNLPPKSEWYIKHLNWVVVLYWWLTIPLYIVTIIVGSMFGDSVSFNLWLASWIIWLAGMFYMLIWNLKHKGRSAFNIFYLLLPFGSIIFLCISNREQLEQDKHERQERDKYLEEYWKEHGDKKDRIKKGWW